MNLAQPDDYTTHIEAPDDAPTIVIQRRFRAPRELVFDAWTKPEHLKNWWGPRSMTLVECTIDLREGGQYRFVQQTPDGDRYGFSGEYLAVERPRRLVYTEAFDAFPDAVATNELVLEEDEAGSTLVTGTVTHTSIENRDAQVGAGMEVGATETHDRLRELLDECALKLSKVVDAPIADVWEAWTSPQVLAEWASPYELRIVSCGGEATPGGRWHTTMAHENGEQYHATGRYLVVEPPHRFVYTHGWENDGIVSHETVMIVDLETIEGGTRVTIHQGVFASTGARDSHIGGWIDALEGLDHHFGGAPLDQGIHIASVGERELEIARAFRAPREQVFHAFNDADAVKAWMGTPRMSMTEAEVDLQPGGKIRYVWTGDEMTMMLNGEYLEVDAPERTVHREVFGEDWTGGAAICTTTYRELGDWTVVRMRLRYTSTEARDGVLASPMAEGMATNFDHLDELLA